MKLKTIFMRCCIFIIYCCA